MNTLISGNILSPFCEVTPEFKQALKKNKVSLKDLHHRTYANEKRLELLSSVIKKQGALIKAMAE